MNKQTSILVAFAFAFFVAFALTANEILSNDNLKTEINTSDKSKKTTCSSKAEKVVTFFKCISIYMIDLYILKLKFIANKFS